MLSREEAASTGSVGKGERRARNEESRRMCICSLMMLLLLEDQVHCIKNLSTEDFCRWLDDLMLCVS